MHVSVCAVILHQLLQGDPGGMVVWGALLNSRIYLITTSGEGDKRSRKSPSRKNEVKLRES